MKAKAFRFGRLSSSQFNDRLDDLNLFLKDKTIEVLDIPQLTSNDEEGTVMFVFYKEKEAKASEKATK